MHKSGKIDGNTAKFVFLILVVFILRRIQLFILPEKYYSP